MTSRPISAALRAARAKSGLTQGELAARLGVSQSAISFWERGTETPSMDRLVALAAELPEVVDGLDDREKELLRRLLRLERQLFAGGCACPGCSCQSAANHSHQAGVVE